MKKIALAPWKIKELPGRSPSTQWPGSLDELNKRLMELEPMSSWSEPLFSKNGKDIYQQAEDFIYQRVEEKKKLIESKADESKLANVDKILGSAISALIGLSVLSADYNKILSALWIIYDIGESYPGADNLIQSVQTTMVHYINELKKIHTDTESHHHLANNSIFGCILLPKEASADYFVDGVSSLTTDGTYLYIYWCSGKGMFKIGTGEGNTIAGKVYLHIKNESISESVSWVYLNNKLYARKVDESLGVLYVISPDTLMIENTVSLHCDERDILNTASSSRFNKNYPLLTDGTYLYIIVMKLTSVTRVLKGNSKVKIEDIKKEEAQEEKKKNEQSKKDKDTNDKNAKKAQPPPSESYQYDEISNKIANKNNGLFGANAADPSAALNNPTDLNEPLTKTIESLKEAKICEFLCIEFDTDTEKYKKIDKAQYRNNKEVQELYDSFSSFFSYETCYRALKTNSDDLEAAATWLIDEGHQDSKQQCMLARRKILLAQAEVINEKMNNRNEQDLSVKDDSTLFPSDINDSYWTLDRGQVTLNKYFRNEIHTRVFSLDEDDVKVLVTEDFTIKPCSDESDEDANELKSPDLKRGSAEINLIQSIVPSTNLAKALNMYEKIDLKGSFIKVIEDVKLLDYEMSLSYDHLYKKFYGLVTSQNTKVVYVAQDMHQMRSGCLTSEEDIKNIGIPEHGQGSGKVSLQSLVHNAMEFFMHFERVRFDLPWRWRRWMTIFAHSKNTTTNQENKIYKRIDKLIDTELNEWRDKFGLDEIIVSKVNPNKKAKPSNPAPTPNYYGRLN